MYFDITAYIHAKGMYYCISRYLYMGYEVLEYVPGSPITRYVRYPDSLVPNTYATPPVTGYLERLLPGMPITQYILAPSNSVLYPHQRLPNMDYHLFVHGSKSHEEGGGGEETGLTAVGGRGVQTPPPTCNASGQLSPRICTERIHSSTQ